MAPPPPLCSNSAVPVANGAANSIETHHFLLSGNSIETAVPSIGSIRF